MATGSNFQETTLARLTRSMLIEQQAENEEYLRNLFPGLQSNNRNNRNNRNNSRRRRHKRKNDRAQTIPEVDPADIPWVLDIEDKSHQVLEVISNTLNSLSLIQSGKEVDTASTVRQTREVDTASTVRQTREVDTASTVRQTREVDTASTVRQTQEVGGNELTCRTHFASTNPSDATSGRQSENKRYKSIKKSLKKALKLARQIESRIPVLDQYNTLPANLQPAGNNRVNQLLSRGTLRRSNSLPNFSEAIALSQMGPMQQSSSDVKSEIPSVTVSTGAKLARKAPPDNGSSCPVCGQLKKVPNETTQGASSTGAIPKRQIVPRTRAPSQTSKRTASSTDRPRWR